MSRSSRPEVLGLKILINFILTHLLSETLEHEMELRSDNDVKRIRPEVDAKGKVDRENADLLKEQLRIKEKERRKTIIDSIQ